MTLRTMLFRDWPLKLTSLLLSGLLWVVASTEQPGSRVAAVTFIPQPPADRLVLSAPATVNVLFVGPRRELLKLSASRVILTRLIPDSVTGRRVVLELSPSDVEIPRGVAVRVEEIQPREVSVELDSVLYRTVPVHPALRLDLDSSDALLRAVQVVPGTVRLSGPAERLARIDSVTTVPLRVDRVEGFFERELAIDTSGFGAVRVTPLEVTISFEIRRD